MNVKIRLRLWWMRLQIRMMAWVTAALRKRLEMYSNRYILEAWNVSFREWLRTGVWWDYWESGE